MKELIGKCGIEKLSFPQKVVIDKVQPVCETKIPYEFNNSFTDICPKLAQKSFESYMNRMNLEMENKPLNVNGLKEAFYSLKTNKNAAYDDISH